MPKIIETDHDGPAELRGNELFATLLKLGPHEGGDTPHVCALCFYRENQHAFHPKDQGDCVVLPRTDPHPKTMFQIKEGEIMPHKIDGVEVGHYCPYWVHFAAD